MGRALLWIVMGYACCLWDTSARIHDLLWPSATGVYLALLVMREPRYGLWGGAICGLVLDAAQGGTLGPRVWGGVLSTSLASHLGLHRAETHWLRILSIVALASVIWLFVPRLFSERLNTIPLLSWSLAQSMATTTLSTALVVLALRRLIPPLGE